MATGGDRDGVTYNRDGRLPSFAEVPAEQRGPPMKYDRLGFPIPPEFSVPSSDGAGPPPLPHASTTATEKPRVNRWKRYILLGVLAAVVVPGLLAPGIGPAVSRIVIDWSLERAMAHEAHDDLRGAIGDLGMAIRWAPKNGDLRSRLLCWRAMLRIENRDPQGAITDANNAIQVAPTLSQPRRVRALARVMLDDTDAALADAQVAVDLAGPNDPEALNHRAYIRALVGRDLEAALADIDAALEDGEGGSPELLDTKGFVLHLLGRHHEAVDLLNVAIADTRRTRLQLAAAVHHMPPDELAYQLRSVDHGLAVMLHHRGLACRGMGLEGQARQDLDEANRLGFAPDRGIF